MAEKRKLAAILAADVVGFSRLTAMDGRCAQQAVVQGRASDSAPSKLSKLSITFICHIHVMSVDTERRQGDFRQGVRERLDRAAALDDYDDVVRQLRKTLVVPHDTQAGRQFASKRNSDSPASRNGSVETFHRARRRYDTVGPTCALERPQRGAAPVAIVHPWRQPGTVSRGKTKREGILKMDRLSSRGDPLERAAPDFCRLPIPRLVTALA